MTYITPDKVYAHLDRLAAWRRGEAPPPVTLEWDLTNRCSRGCDGCHFAYTHTRGPLAKRRQADTGDEADTPTVLRALEQAAQMGVQGVVWTGGGEPTLHPDFDTITTFAHVAGLKQGVYTHGGHIDAVRGRRMARHFAWAVVSLDAHDAASYTAYKGSGFATACDGVRHLTGGNCVVGASFLLGRNTWQDAPAMLALGRSLGASYATFRPMILYDLADPAVASEDTGWITAALPMLQSLADTEGVICDVSRFIAYRDWKRERPYTTCYGVRLNATITPDGRVWVCPNRRGFEGSSIGSIHHDSLSTIWERHPGQWTDFTKCRVMCRLHQVNERLAALEAPMPHTEFV
jgi:MoaA/NifB/PqqE/SkfB family radical SAM enzyme